MGAIWRPHGNLILRATLWKLDSDQEFVYVGDEGIVEPSGRSSRSGIEGSIRYQPFRWLFWYGDVNLTRARALDVEQGAHFIPLAPSFTFTSGATIRSKQGYSGGIHVRHLANRPANETNSLIAGGFTILDANANYPLGRCTLGISIKNLFNQSWNEAQFATTSLLQGELTPTEEIHFTPGAPFHVTSSIAFQF